MHIALQDARSILRRKMLEILGEDVIWLPQYEEIAEWLSDNKGKGLLLRGGQGVGKSFITREILVPIIKDPRLLRKNIIEVTPYDIGKKIERITADGVPVFYDDLGLESPYQYMGNTIDPFVMLTYYAEVKGMFLLLTTNLSADDIVRRYGPRVADRLNYLCKTIEINSNSFRK